MKFKKINRLSIPFKMMLLFTLLHYVFKTKILVHPMFWGGELLKHEFRLSLLYGFLFGLIVYLALLLADKICKKR
jgi:hypothetical protein